MVRNVHLDTFILLSGQPYCTWKHSYSWYQDLSLLNYGLDTQPVYEKCALQGKLSFILLSLKDLYELVAEARNLTRTSHSKGQEISEGNLGVLKY